MKQLTWALLLLIPAGAYAADVYRFVDENGVVVYSDRPSGAANEQRIVIAASTVTAQPSTPAPSSTTPADGAADEAARDSRLDGPLVAEFVREPTPEEIAADRARNCETARARNESVSTAHRLYRNTADGEREYLTSEEIDQTRASAAADVAAWCD